MPLERQTINRINHRKLKTLWQQLVALNTKLSIQLSFSVANYVVILQPNGNDLYSLKFGYFSNIWQFSSNQYLSKLVPLQFLHKRLWKWLLFCTDDRPPNVFCNCNNVIQYKYVLVRREREYVCSFCKQLACWLKSPK